MAVRDAIMIYSKNRFVKHFNLRDILGRGRVGVDEGTGTKIRIIVSSIFLNMQRTDPNYTTKNAPQNAFIIFFFLILPSVKKCLARFARYFNGSLFTSSKNFEKL